MLTTNSKGVVRDKKHHEGEYSDEEENCEDGLQSLRTAGVDHHYDDERRGW